MTPEVLDNMLVEAAREGRGSAIAAGLISIDLLASVVFLTDSEGDKSKHAALADAVQRTNGNAHEFAKVAVGKLAPKDMPADTMIALGHSMVVAIMAQTTLLMTADACGVGRVQVSGMVGMCIQSLLNDLRAVVGEAKTGGAA